MNWKDVPHLLVAGVILWMVCFFLSKWLGLSKEPFHYPTLSTKQAWAFLLIGGAISIGFGWVAALEFGDPWALSQARRSQGAHQWSLGVMASASALLFLQGVWVGAVRLVGGDRSRRDPRQEPQEIQPVSPEERQVLLAELASDRLWNEGGAAHRG